MVNDNDTSQELEDIARAFKQDKDTQPIEQDLSPNPTPNLTAERFTSDVVCVANPCCLDEDIEFAAARQNVLPMVVNRDARIRRKTFEQAAESASACMAKRGLSLPHRLAVIAAIRALAKA